MLIFNDENWKCDVKSAAVTQILCSSESLFSFFGAQYSFCHFSAWMGMAHS